MNKIEKAFFMVWFLALYKVNGILSIVSF